MKPLLQLENVKVNFPVKSNFFDMILGKEKQYVHAINGISISIESGEILALVGESGSGKTTLGKIINVLHDPDIVSGQVLFNGVPILDENGKLMEGYRQNVCMIFQDPYQSLNPKHNIEKIVSEPLIINKITKSKDEIRKKIIEALENAGLSPANSFLDRYPHELSGGQRQRVVIASALVLDPKLIIADEPVSMLDVSIRADILKLMMRLRDEKGISYLFITHDISLAWAISDKIGVMYLGTLMEYGDTKSVTETPKNPYTQALIEIMPKMNIRKNQKRALLKGETPNPIQLPTGCVFHPRCPKVQEVCMNKKPDIQVFENQQISACHFTFEKSVVK